MSEALSTIQFCTKLISYLLIFFGAVVLFDALLEFTIHSSSGYISKHYQILIRREARRCLMGLAIVGSILEMRRFNWTIFTQNLQHFVKSIHAVDVQLQTNDTEQQLDQLQQAIEKQNERRTALNKRLMNIQQQIDNRK